MELNQYAAEHIIENGKHYPEKWVNRYFIEMADAQRALDAEREKVKDLDRMYRFSIAERNKLNAETDELALEIDSRDSQLATLQAQLRQVEGERDGLEQNCLNNHVTIEQADEKVKTLRQLVEAIYRDLPARRDWLDPALEARMQAALQPERGKP